MPHEPSLKALRTLNNFWTPGWTIGLLIIPMVLSTIGLVMSLWQTREKNYRKIEETFVESPCFVYYRRHWGAIDFKSRWYLVNLLTGALTFPGFQIRRGNLIEKEFLAFPAGLRFRMVLAGIFSFVGFVWLMIGVGLLKLSRM